MSQFLTIVIVVSSFQALLEVCPSMVRRQLKTDLGERQGPVSD